MMVYSAQKKKIKRLFDALPASVMGHSIRTGIIMQTFIDALMASAPGLLEKQGVTDYDDMLTCAREFGFYHHIADNSEKSPADLILHIFKGAINADGFYVNGLIDTVETHSEKWDGSGEKKLSGHTIPFWGRVCAIAEAYDNLTNTSTPRKAISIMSSLSGIAFDPELCSVFLKCYPELRSFVNSTGISRLRSGTM